MLTFFAGPAVSMLSPDAKYLQSATKIGSAALYVFVPFA
jgi:hypothetical protein